MPVPLSAMAAVLPLVALLLMVTVPVSAPAAVGSNCRSSVTVWPALSVSGVVIPLIEKPVPLIAAALMVTDPVPLNVSFTVCVAGEFRFTLPKTTVVDPSVSPAVPVVPPDAFNCSEKVSELLLAEAISVAVCAEVTAEAVAVKLALDAPAATVTDAGTLTALLLLARLTVIAPPVAAVSVTVQASVTAPVSVPLPQESALNESCEPPPQCPRCWPNRSPGAQHRMVTIPANRRYFDAPEPRPRPDRASNCEGWLHCNASSVATARLKEGGISLNPMVWHL